MSLPTQTDYSAFVLEDSVNRDNQRLTTLVVTFPRQVLSEFNTHRVLAKNSASSRARPAMKVVEEVLHHPFIPETVGVNQSGMQASQYLDDEMLQAFQEQILVQRDRRVLELFENLLNSETVRKVLGPLNYESLLVNGLGEYQENVFNTLKTFYSDFLKRKKAGSLSPLDDLFFNPHKQTVNRYLEPYMWHTVIVTGTEWGNFFGLRDHDDADPSIHKIASLMRRAMDESQPEELSEGEWHTPFLKKEEKAQVKDNPQYWLSVSTGRCARVSYVNHFGERNPDQDVDLAQKLLESGHMSPFEHVATPDFQGENSNFVGWKQLRKFIPHEDDYSKRPANIEFSLQELLTI